MRPAQPLRTLPQAAPSLTPSSQTDAQTQWKLRWRPSHQITPSENAEATVESSKEVVSNGLTLRNSTPELLPLAGNSTLASNRMRTPEPPISNPVRRVKFAQESIIDSDAPALGGESLPPRIARPASSTARPIADVWSDPFGDQSGARSASLPQDNLTIPPVAGNTQPPADEPESLSDGPTIPPTLGVPNANGGNEAPVDPSENISPSIPQVPNLEVPDSPEAPVESPSDQENVQDDIAPNIPSLEQPRSRANPIQEADAWQDDRATMRNREAAGGGLVNPDFLQVNCDEFGMKMAARTIQAVSLDISPPFRPDILEEDSFEQAKAEFLESQPIRQWRDREGKLVAEGRFIDIAFEQAIVETEDGEEVALLLSHLSQQDLSYVTESWGLPSECQLPQIAYQPREWLPVQMTWKASNLYHKPLYFEEVNLERYGHTAGPTLQPLVSTAHFFVNIAVLPYKMGIHPPSECQYALGYYRPGNCAPWIIPPVPLSLRGAMFEAAAIGAGIGIIP